MSLHPCKGEPVYVLRQGGQWQVEVVPLDLQGLHGAVSHQATSQQPEHFTVLSC